MSDKAFLKWARDGKSILISLCVGHLLSRYSRTDENQEAFPRNSIYSDMLHFMLERVKPHVLPADQGQNPPIYLYLRRNKGSPQTRPSGSRKKILNHSAGYLTKTIAPGTKTKSPAPYTTSTRNSPTRTSTSRQHGSHLYKVKSPAIYSAKP